MAKFNLNEWLVENENWFEFSKGGHYKGKHPHIHCADGFTMSVQASEGHYCSPRQDIGPYTSVEVGLVSTPEPLLEPHALDGAVYDLVPVEVVEQIVKKHGGLAIRRGPPHFKETQTHDREECLYGSHYMGTRYHRLPCHCREPQGGERTGK